MQEQEGYGGGNNGANNNNNNDNDDDDEFGDHSNDIPSVQLAVPKSLRRLVFRIIMSVLFLNLLLLC